MLSHRHFDIPRMLPSLVTVTPVCLWPSVARYNLAVNFLCTQTQIKQENLSLIHIFFSNNYFFIKKHIHVKGWRETNGIKVESRKTLSNLNLKSFSRAHAMAHPGSRESHATDT